MMEYKRKDFRKWYRKLHDLKDEIDIFYENNENDLEKLDLHHIIPFEKINNNVDIKIIDTLPNLICLRKKLHCEISKKIGEGIPYFGIKFYKDENGVYNSVSFFNIKGYESPSKSYFQYNNATRFINKDLVFFNPELAGFIEKYNNTCLEINKNQLLGIWKKNCTK